VVRTVGRGAGVPTTARRLTTTVRAPAREMSAGLHAPLGEPTWELPHDSRAQPIGHGENMQMHRLIVGDAYGEVAVALKPLDPSAKVTIARRVHVT
jgi:hypothetical protein